MLNGAIGTLGPKPGRSHIFLINSGSLNLRKMCQNVGPGWHFIWKKHRLGRSELGFSPANSANKFSSSEVQIAMLASLPRCWELHAITSYKNCTTHRVNQSNLGKSRVCTDCYTVSTAKIYFRNCFFSCFCFCSIQTEAKTVRIDCHARACNVSQILDKWRMFWVEAKDSGEWTTWLSMGSSQQHVFLQSTSQQH